MKIGTLTFHRAINFGAVMQTFALQKYLLNLGAKSEVIDYRCDYLEEVYKPFYLKKTSIKMLVYKILKNGFFRNNRKNFDKFILKNINLSNEIYNDKSKLKECNKIYDKIIVGSDQVWNYKCTNFDKSYFLDFVDNDKKYSYAASIGLKNIPLEYSKEYKDLISKFNCISVREIEALNILKENFDINSVQSLDPTFLLNKEEYINISEKRKGINEKYILLYMIGKSKSAFKFSNYLSKKYNLKVVYINEYLLPHLGVNNQFYVKPEEWLWLINNATYIVTNSFHGMALSLKFQKEFFMDEGIINKDYTRINNILHKLNLGDRIIKENIDLNSKINYEDVDKLLNNEIEKSCDYLRRIINE